VLGPILAAFGVTAMCGWSSFGERSATCLFGDRCSLPYRLLFVGMVAALTFVNLKTLWLATDILISLMLIPNLLGLLLLSGVVRRETRRWMQSG